jgi:molybdopterin synthase sulfur carrier subunit
MVKVHLWSGLRRFTDGADVVEVEAKTVGEMMKALVEAHPGLDPVIKAGVSVSVDCKLIARGLHEQVSDDSEVFLLRQLKGG